MSNPLSRLPVIGPAIAMIGPAIFGAIGIELVGQMHVLASKFGIEVPEMMLPFTYSIGGLLVAGLIQMLTFLPPTVRYSLGLATASAGGAVDMYRYRESKGAYGALELGDGGEWTIDVDPRNLGALELGDEDELGALELGDDAEAVEARDFSEAEGTCLADEGYGAFHRKFIRPHGKAILKDHARRRNTEGPRWMWLKKKIGAEGMQELANLKPEKRVHYIKEVRQAIKQGIQPAPQQRRLTEVPGIQNQNMANVFSSDWESSGWGPSQEA